MTKFTLLDKLQLAEVCWIVFNEDAPLHALELRLHIYFMYMFVISYRNLNIIYLDVVYHDID